MLFADRADAGRHLARRLLHLRGTPADGNYLVAARPARHRCHPGRLFRGEHRCHRGAVDRRQPAAGGHRDRVPRRAPGPGGPQARPGAGADTSGR